MYEKIKMNICIYISILYICTSIQYTQRYISLSLYIYIHMFFCCMLVMRFVFLLLFCLVNFLNIARLLVRLEAEVPGDSCYYCGPSTRFQQQHSKSKTRKIISGFRTNLDVPMFTIHLSNLVIALDSKRAWDSKPICAM